MGTENLSQYIEGETILSEHPNDITKALLGNFVPRNTSGVPEDVIGTLGQGTLRWLRAYIASGYFQQGMIIPYITYGNTFLYVPQGWYPCDGTIINATNYDNLPGHSSGDWTKYASGSPFLGKYAPNLVGKYLVGAASTPQNGSSPFTYVGNAGNTVNLQHNHQWYDATGNNAHDLTYNSAGTPIALPSSTKSVTSGTYKVHSAPTDVDEFDPTVNTWGDSYTSNGLSASQSIQPESLQVIYILRII